MGYVWQLPHSIIIQTYDDNDDKEHSVGSYTTYKLAPSSRPVIQPAKPYSKELTSNWIDGSIDISNILSSEPSYGLRTCEIEFYVLNTLDNINAGQWYQRYDRILSMINGKRCILTLQDDIKPRIGYSYTGGRVFVKSWKSEKDRSKITLAFKLFPYKITEYVPPEDWPDDGWPPTPSHWPRYDEDLWKYANNDYDWKWNGLFGTAITFGYFEIHGGDGTWKDIINPINKTITTDVLITGGNIIGTRYAEFDYSRSSSATDPSILFQNGYSKQRLVLHPDHNYYYFNTQNGTETTVSMLVIRDESLEVHV